MNILHGLFSRVYNRFIRSSVGHRVLARVGREPCPERWLFILGCYNSGTTLLNAVLSRHPSVSGLPAEGVRLTDALSWPESYGWTRMWHRCLDEIRLTPGPGMRDRARRIQRQWSVLYDTNRPNLIEKSIPNAARAPFLQEYFRPAHFIHLVRNGYAVAEGIRRKADPQRWNNPAYTGSYPINLCARQWRITEELIEADRPHLDRILTVRYEDFTEEPVRVLSAITDFLGIEPIPDDVVSRRWGVHGYDAPIRNMNGKSFEALSSHDVDAITREAEDVLRAYDYAFPPAAVS